MDPAPIPRGHLLAYCELAQRFGLSRRAALELLRSHGAGVRTATFLELWRGAQAAEQAFVPLALRRAADG